MLAPQLEYVLTYIGPITSRPNHGLCLFALRSIAPHLRGITFRTSNGWLVDTSEHGTSSDITLNIKYITLACRGPSPSEYRGFYSFLLPLDDPREDHEHTLNEINAALSEFVRAHSGLASDTPVAPEVIASLLGSLTETEEDQDEEVPMPPSFEVFTPKIVAL